MATTDNRTKPLNRRKPFSRINSPVFNSTRARVSGRGFQAGCRALQDFPSGVDFIVNNIAKAGKKIVRAVPNWVSVPEAVEGLGNLNGDMVHKPMELQGTLIRSFQTWTDFPAYQWHRWFDWNFHLEPDTGYEFVRGRGNEPPSFPAGRIPVATSISMECEWDSGGVGTRPGPLFNSHEVNPARASNNDVGESANNWSWPMTGQYIWIAGRWIYDCGHSNPPDDKDRGLMRAELHPCKCMATARWGAFAFEENDGLFTPAIEFTFFAHRIGAYKNWARLNDEDYEFIVDLPELDNAPLEWDIGVTPENPLNTGVLREPHLLIHTDFELFDSAATIDNHSIPSNRRNAVQPIIEPIRVEGQPVRQVHVKIPLTQMPPTTDIYGVRLWLGWHDPDKQQAQKVKEVTVTLDRVVVGPRTHDDASENPLFFLNDIPIFGLPIRLLTTNLDAEWQLRIGVNNHWIQTPVIEDVEPRSTLRRGIQGKKFKFHMVEGDDLAISVHGAEIDPVGDFMLENTLLGRTLFVETDGGGKTEANWDTHIVNSARNEPILRRTLKGMIDLMKSTLGMENGALGLLEPRMPNNDRLTPDPDKDHNPLKIGQENFDNREFSLSAFPVSEVGELAELVADPAKIDYTLHYKVSVKPQAGLGKVMLALLSFGEGTLGKLEFGAPVEREVPLEERIPPIIEDIDRHKEELWLLPRPETDLWLLDRLTLSSPGPEAPTPASEVNPLLQAVGVLGIREGASHAIRHLKHPDPEVQRSAIEALGRTGNSENFRELEPFLRGSSPELARMAILALAHFPEAPQGPAVDAAVQRYAGLAETAGIFYQQLALVRAEDTQGYVVANLRYEHREDLIPRQSYLFEPMVRAASDPDLAPWVVYLWMLGREQQAAPLLAGMVNQPQVPIEVRRMAAKALGRIGVRGAASVLIEGLDSGDPGLQRECVIALGRIGRTKAIEPLFAHWDAEGGALHAEIVRALARLARSPAGEWLLEAVERGQRPPAEALWLVTDRGVTRGYDPALVTPELANPEPSARYDALLLFGGYCADSEIGHIELMSREDPDARVRWLAARLYRARYGVRQEP